MAPSRRSAGLALAGLALGVAGVAGYFVVVTHFGAALPDVRNRAVPDWLAVAVGLVCSLLAVRRATPGRRALAVGLLSANALLAGAFAFVLYDFSAVPAAPGPSVGAPAPDFALRDETGSTRTLAEFRGGPLLLVFYRGHW